MTSFELRRSKTRTLTMTMREKSKFNPPIYILLNLCMCNSICTVYNGNIDRNFLSVVWRRVIALGYDVRVFKKG